MIRRVDHLSVLTDWPGERLAVRLTGIQWNACPDLAANNDLSVGNAFRAAIKLESNTRVFGRVETSFV